NRYVQVFTDQHTFAVQIQIRHFDYRHDVSSVDHFGGCTTGLTEFGAGRQAAHAARGIQHAVGKAPFVIEPHQQFQQVATTDTRLRGSDTARACVVVELNGGVRLAGNAQNAAQVAGGGGLYQVIPRL